jgi:LysM repeat protein
MTTQPRVKLRSAATRGRGGVLAADAEPNMRLSRAILVFLLLHIVAVGGICAFSLIKQRGPAGGQADGAVEAEDSHLGSSDAPHINVDLPATGPNVHTVSNHGSPDARALIEGDAADEPDGASSHAQPDTSRTYIVQKGDTPARIAKKLKVSQSALLKLNGVDDPRKLKPGQKLRLPPSTKTLAKN